MNPWQRYGGRVKIYHTKSVVDGVLRIYNVYDEPMA